MQLQPPPKKFLSTLLEVRDYYAPLVEKYEKLYREALDNLNHVEALLSNWSVTLDVEKNGSNQKVSEEILTSLIRQSLDASDRNHILVSKPELIESEATEVPQTEENLSSPQLDQSESAVPTLENLSSDDSEDIAETESDDSEANEPLATSEETAASEEDIEEASELEDSAATPSEPEQAAQTGTKSLLWSDIPMLSEYQSLRRIEAVEKLLQNHLGSVCHIDFIVRSLYGDLKPDVFKVAKGRVQSTLTYGKESGKWALIPGKPGCYTLDLKLLNSPRKDSASKPSKINNKKPDPEAKTNSIPMQGEYEGKFLIDAITLLLQKNPKKVFDVTEVINKLYGKLSDEEVQEVRSKVLNELSRGYRTGRFSKVPDEKGLYIWDSKLLPKVSRK
ncbi:hypothetical protein [Nostoc sp. FACHB-110]|uniref:hypothetical protein n=1 Tax=Nostoc sp. FACHB-110 TaxID=2692834 RepID=UPI001688AAFE|nr:hypothetical protein [Nostoc sp. FACHB-110]MBD2435624.1 hypothetical protein [Nostoc sp. FACHB-110]